MKKPKYIKHILTTLTILVFSLLAFPQMMEPEDPGGDPVGEDPLGGGAPLSGGTLVLTILGAAYGARKMYSKRLTKKPTEFV